MDKEKTSRTIPFKYLINPIKTNTSKNEKNYAKTKVSITKPSGINAILQ